MTASETTAPETSEMAAQVFLDTFLQAAWQPALRLAADLEGAPARCKRRACKTAKSCRLEWEEGKHVNCGGGFSPATAMVAASHAQFAAIMALSYAEDIVLPERKLLLDRFWKDFGVPMEASRASGARP